MSIKDRRNKERDDKRELILKSANEIIMEEGIDGLSVRKIGNRIDYSPSIIYHYFKDKEDIINQLMQKSYQKIISTVSSVNSTNCDPRTRLKEMSKKYIELALQMPEEYLNIMLNSSPEILAHTSVLSRDSVSKRPALGMLKNCLRELYKDVDNREIELYTQVIWASTFGLIIRLIIERDVDEDQRTNLINHHINFILESCLPNKF